MPMAGRLSDAEEVFKKAGKWNRCYAYHGYVLAKANDIEGAKRPGILGRRPKRCP